MTETKVEIFNQHRPLLFGIAWRMLGKTTDAEDILQEAFIRWQRTVEADIRSPRTFLVTVVTRLCLNHLDLAHVKHEQPYETEASLENDHQVSQPFTVTATPYFANANRGTCPMQVWMPETRQITEAQRQE